jgi:hypothetical protein
MGGMETDISKRKEIIGVLIALDAEFLERGRMCVSYDGLAIVLLQDRSFS